MKIRLLVGLTAVICLAVVGVVVASGGSSSGSDSHAANLRLASDQERPLAAVLSPDSSAPVADIAEGFPQIKGARVASALPDGTQVLALHGTANDPSKICVFALSDTKPRSIGGSCNTVDHFNESGVAATIGPAPHALVVGLVPDGVTTVTLRVQDGSTHTATVENNSYAFTPTAAPDEVTFQGPNGPVTHSVASIGAPTK